MALTVGTNSYIDVPDASAYMADRLHAEAWATASDDERAAALITATRAIDRLPLAGAKADPGQRLAFPRMVRTAGGWVADTDVPQAVRDAVCEQALFLLEMTQYERDRRRNHALGMIGGGIGQANEYSDTMLVRRATENTPIAPAARELLRPYLARAVPIRGGRP